MFTKYSAALEFILGSIEQYKDDETVKKLINDAHEIVNRVVVIEESNIDKIRKVMNSYHALHDYLNANVLNEDTTELILEAVDNGLPISALLIYEKSSLSADSYGKLLVALMDRDGSDAFNVYESIVGKGRLTPLDAVKHAVLKDIKYLTPLVFNVEHIVELITYSSYHGKDQAVLYFADLLRK